MSTKWLIAIVFLTCFLALGLALGCNGGGDDDDDSDGDPCSTFCGLINNQCDLSGELGLGSQQECLNYCDGISDQIRNCVANAESCAEVRGCLGLNGDDDVADDDVADDDTADDDVTDDDTGDTGTGPNLSTFHLYVGAEDFTNFMGETYGTVVGIHEFGYVEVEWYDASEWDSDCDLKGGRVYYSLDGGDAVDYKIIPDIACDYDDYPNLFGYDLRDIDGALDETKAGHALEVWWIDAHGNESNHRTYNYTVEDSPYAHGAEMDNFTLMDHTGGDVSLTDFAGRIVAITAFTGWCSYCKLEAAELDDAQIAYDANSDPVSIMGMMGETATGSTTITTTDLTNWREAYNWDVAGIPALADGGFAFIGSYFLSGGVPYNIILDSDHIIRVKWHGWGSGLVESVVDDLLEEM